MVGVVFCCGSSGVVLFVWGWLLFSCGVSWPQVFPTTTHGSPPLAHTRPAFIGLSSPLDAPILNKLYSPLSIKYALEMLAEGANGESKEQISNIIGTYNAKKYTNSSNMSFANALFIKNSFKK